MPTTFGFSLNFGDGDPLTTATAEIMDATGAVFQTIPQSAMHDVSGTTPPNGRRFGGTATVPDGILSGFYRGRDNLTPELILDVLPFNLFQGQASIIIPSPPVPVSFAPGAAASQGFTTVTLPSGAATDATGTPTGSLQRNGVTDGTVAVTVARIGLASYVASWTTPAGYVTGDVVAVLVSATVAGVAASRFVCQAPVQATASGGLPSTSLTVKQGDTTDLSIPVTPGSLAGATGLRFVGKTSPALQQAPDDSDSDLVVDQLLGLEVLRMAPAAVPGDASIVGNGVANTATLHLAADVTAALNPDLVLFCAVKASYGTTEREIAQVTLTVTAGRVLAVV